MGLFLSWGMKLGVPLEWGHYLWDHPELHNGCRVPFGVSRRNVGFLLRHCSGKGPHLALRGELRGFSRVVAGSLGFLLSCDGDLRDPLVASEKSGLFSSCEGLVGIPLEWLLANRAMFRGQSVNSIFLSSGDRDLGLPVKVQLGSQAVSGVEAWNAAFLWSCKRGVRPPVKFRWGIWAFSR